MDFFKVMFKVRMLFPDKSMTNGRFMKFSEPIVCQSQKFSETTRAFFKKHSKTNTDEKVGNWSDGNVDVSILHK